MDDENNLGDDANNESEGNPTAPPITEPTEPQSLFWIKVSKKTQITLPQSLTQLLSHQGFDNEAALRSLTEESIDQVQSFARRVLSKKLKTCEKSIVFGFFSDVPDEFEILPGHRQLLLEVASKMKDTKILVPIQHEGKKTECKNLNPGKTNEKHGEDHLIESKKILENTIDKALLRDFNLSSEAGKPLYILSLKDEHNGTVLCQVEECSKRKHVVTLTRSVKRPWSTHNFYRHVRAVHFTLPAKKQKIADENQETESDSSTSRPNSPIQFSDEEPGDSSNSKTDS